MTAIKIKNRSGGCDRCHDTINRPFVERLPKSARIDSKTGFQVDRIHANCHSYSNKLFQIPNPIFLKTPVRKLDVLRKADAPTICPQCHHSDPTILRGYTPPIKLPSDPKDYWRLEIAQRNFIKLIKKSYSSHNAPDSRSIFLSFTELCQALLNRHRLLDYRAYIEALRHRSTSQMAKYFSGSGQTVNQSWLGNDIDASLMEKARSKAAEALIRDYYSVFDRALGAVKFGEMRNSFTSRVHNVMGEMLSMAGERTLARKYYLKAQHSSVSVLNDRRNWLLAFKQLGIEEQQKRVGELWDFVRNKVSIIRELNRYIQSIPSSESLAYLYTMGSTIPPMMRLSMMADSADMDPWLREKVWSDPMLRKEPPTAEQLSRLELFALKIIADVELENKDSEQREKQMGEIAKRVLRIINSRVKTRNVSPVEASLAMAVVKRVMYFAASHQGPIENTRYFKTKYVWYVDLINKAIAMGRRFKRSAQGELIRNLESGLIWARDFDAVMALRSYKEAVNNVREKIIPEYGSTPTSKDRLVQLQIINPHWFANGKLKNHIDVSDTEIGRLAEAREASSYKLNGDVWEKIGVPVAGAFIGAGVGCAIGGIIGFFTPAPGGAAIGCKIGSYPGAAAGAGLSSYGYQRYQISKHSKEISEAAALGFTLISPREAQFYDKVAMRTVMVDSVMGLLWAKPAVGVVRFVGSTAKGLAQKWVAIGGLRGMGQAAAKWGTRQWDKAGAVAGRLADMFVPSTAPGLTLAGAGGYGQAAMPIFMSGGARGGGRVVLQAGASARWTTRLWDWMVLQKQNAQMWFKGAGDAGGGFLKEWWKEMGGAVKRSLFFAPSKLGPYEVKILNWAGTKSQLAGRVLKWPAARKTPILFWTMGPYSGYDFYRNGGRFSVAGGLTFGMGVVPPAYRLLLGLRAGGMRVTSFFYLLMDGLAQWQQGADVFRPSGNKLAIDTMYAGPLGAVAKVLYKGLHEVQYSVGGAFVWGGRYLFDNMPLARTRSSYRWLTNHAVAIENKVYKNRLWIERDHFRIPLPRVLQKRLNKPFLKLSRPDGEAMKIYNWKGKAWSLGFIALPVYGLVSLQAKHQEGDSGFMQAQRMIAYAFGGLVSYPIQAPLGMDTTLAVSVGRTMYLPVAFYLNEQIPKYINKIPAYGVALDDASRKDYSRAQRRLHQTLVTLNPYDGVKSWFHNPDNRKGWERYYRVHQKAIREYINVNTKVLAGAGKYGYDKLVTADSGDKSYGIELAHGYLGWVEWKLNRIKDGKARYPVLMNHTLLNDAAIMEKFAAADEASYQHAGTKYVQQRMQLVKRVRRILREYNKTIAEIRSSYGAGSIQRVSIPRP